MQTVVDFLGTKGFASEAIVGVSDFNKMKNIIKIDYI